MSGGSFNYLSAESAFEVRWDLMAMHAELDRRATENPAYVAARKKHADLLNKLREARALAEELEALWHAVEWHVSGDWSEEDALYAQNCPPPASGRRGWRRS